MDRGEDRDPVSLDENAGEHNDIYLISPSPVSSSHNATPAPEEFSRRESHSSPCPPADLNSCSSDSDEVSIVGTGRSGDQHSGVTELVNSRGGILDPRSFRNKSSTISLLDLPEEIPSPLRPKSTLPAIRDEDERKMRCPICLERWSASGSHRVCTLRCGHLFGLSCIRQWTNANGRRAACPMCHKIIFNNDIVCLYIDNVYAVESAEMDLINERWKSAKNERDKLKTSAAKMKRDITNKDSQIASLQQEVSRLKKMLSRAYSQPKPTCNTTGSSSRHPTPLASIENQLPRSRSLPLSKTTEIPIQTPVNYLPFVQTHVIPIPGARTAEFYSDEQAVIVNSKHPSTHKHGLYKISVTDPTIRQDCWFHSDSIRDIKYQNNLLLCASFDSSASIVDARNLNQVVTFPVGVAAWSCAWSLTDASICYVGTRTGEIKVFDIRKPSECVAGIVQEHDPQPCHSLSCLLPEWKPQGVQDVILCGQMNTVRTIVHHSDATLTQCHSIFSELEGKCISAQWHPHSACGLISFRSSREYSRSSHHLFRVAFGDSDSNVPIFSPSRVLYTPTEQQLLSRSLLFSTKSPHPWSLVAANEGQRTRLWDAESGVVVQSIDHGNVLDIRAMIHSDSLRTTGKRRRSSECGPDFLCTVDKTSLRLHSTCPG